MRPRVVDGTVALQNGRPAARGHVLADEYGLGQVHYGAVCPGIAEIDQTADRKANSGVERQNVAWMQIVMGKDRLPRWRDDHVKISFEDLAQLCRQTWIGAMIRELFKRVAGERPHVRHVVGVLGLWQSPETGQLDCVKPACQAADLDEDTAIILSSG